MKLIPVAFAFLLVGVTAWPSHHSNELESAIRSGEPRIITGAIVMVIDRVAQAIAENGLDPLVHEGLELDYGAPVPTVFNARAHIRGINSRGLSNIVINHMDYALFASRLTFNVELPGVAVSVDDSAWDVNILSGNLNGAFSGSVALRHLIVTGIVRINIGIISGISVTQMDLTVDIGSVDTSLNLQLQGVDVSAPLNKFLSETVPNVLKDYQDDINELVSIVAHQIVESIL